MEEISERDTSSSNEDEEYENVWKNMPDVKITQEKRREWEDTEDRQKVNWGSDEVRKKINRNSVKYQLAIKMKKMLDPMGDERKSRFTTVLQTVAEDELKQEIYAAVKHEKIIDAVGEFTSPVRKNMPRQMRKNLTEVKKTLSKAKRKRQL
jgi:hypothetical protein